MLTCISSVLPLPVAFQKASLRRSASFIGGIWSVSSLVGVELLDKGVQVGKQFLGVTEKPVQVDLREEQRQPLEILPADRLIAPLVKSKRVLDDVLVVAQQHVAGKLLQLPQQP